MSRNRSKGVMWPLVLLSAACGGGFERGAPIPDADEIAAHVRETSGATNPTHVVFEWEYADERGNFRGEGSARVNPPDRFRLDLFATGEGSMQATLVEGEIQTGGDLEGVELPPAVFLYAMTGVFRPGGDEPLSGFESRDLRVLEYAGEAGTSHFFYVAGDRLVRVEERLGNRRQRWIDLDWGSDEAWPAEARYRDEIGPAGVRWKLLSATPAPRPYDERIYALPIPR